MRNLDQITEALRRLLPDGGSITAIRPLTTGFSNDTYIIEGPDLILRLPPAAGAMLNGHDVIAQAQIYQTLQAVAKAPPVPRIVKICSDQSGIGEPFFVMERIAGEPIDDIELISWYVDGPSGLRRQIGVDWISAFAALSTLEPIARLGPAVTPEDNALVWREFARAANAQTLAGLFDRLLTAQAPRSGPPSIVHGDPKLSNLMWHDERITAMLDWEMALNGEPLADLGYMLFPFQNEYHGATRASKLTGMLSRDDVIALWSQVSGRSADGVFWHEIAQIGKIAAIIAKGVNLFDTGRSRDPRLALFKQNFGYFLGVMQAMLESAEFDELKERPCSPLSPN